MEESCVLISEICVSARLFLPNGDCSTEDFLITQLYGSIVYDNVGHM
jgi:hypothetical protein